MIFEGKSELLELIFYIELKVEITVIPRFIKRHKKCECFYYVSKKNEIVRNLDQGTRGRRKGLYISEGFFFFINDI